MPAKVVRFINRWSWWLLIAALPFTSFPLVAKLTGSSSVAGLSLPFLGVLALLFLAPLLYRRRRLFPLAAPLAGFVLVFLLSMGLSIFLVPPMFKGISALRNQLEALVTLGIGLAFYLVTVFWLDSEEKFRRTLQIVHISGALIIVWSLTQAVVWRTMPLNLFPVWIQDIQGFFALGRLYWGRAVGFALEPSWLAHQLNMLYLPVWLACTVQNYSVFQRRIWKFSAENFLLAGGALVFFLTFSRVGWLAFLLMLAYLFLLLNYRLAGWLQTRLFRGRAGSNPAQMHRLTRWLIWGGMLVVYLSLLAGALFAFSRFDRRMADLLYFDPSQDYAVLRYADRLRFSERLIYWDAGLRLFDAHPLLGVGPGNAGFYLPGNLTGFGYFTVEVRDILYRSNQLLNIKSMWIRLLAETGILGFGCFLIWFGLSWRVSARLSRMKDPLIGTIGLISCFALIGFVIEGFSIDSYALPYLWISSGFGAAAILMVEKKNDADQ